MALPFGFVVSDRALDSTRRTFAGGTDAVGAKVVFQLVRRALRKRMKMQQQRLWVVMKTLVEERKKENVEEGVVCEEQRMLVVMEKEQKMIDQTKEKFRASQRKDEGQKQPPQLDAFVVDVVVAAVVEEVEESLDTVLLAEHWLLLEEKTQVSQIRQRHRRIQCHQKYSMGWVVSLAQQQGQLLTIVVLVMTMKVMMMSPQQ